MNTLRNILALLLLSLASGVPALAATGDVVIDVMQASGLRKGTLLTPQANYFIGFDSSGNLVVKTGGTWGTITGTLADQTDLQNALNGKAASAHNQAWSTITDTPTTLSGYGITDAASLSGSYSNPSWITGLAWSKISGAPTTLSGYGITDAQPLDADLTSIAALSGTNTIYYRSASNTWSAVTVGSGLSFSGGTLSSSSGGDMLKSVYDPQNSNHISGHDGATPVDGGPGGFGGVLSMDGGDGSAPTGMDSGGNGGSINLNGAHSPGAENGGNGGSIDLSGFEDMSGGNIITSGGGGTLDTYSGYLELGTIGNRTIIDRPSGGTDYTFQLPNVPGVTGQTLVIDDDTADVLSLKWDTPSGGSGHVIEDDGTPMTARSALNFTGNVTVTDDAMGDATVIDILGGSGSPAGSGTELQYRVDGSTFGAVTNSSVSGKTITLGGAENLGAATNVAYLTLRNTTPATVGAPLQSSPSLKFISQVWDPDDAVSRETISEIRVVPLSHNTQWQAPFAFFTNGISLLTLSFGGTNTMAGPLAVHSNHISLSAGAISIGSAGGFKVSNTPTNAFQPAWWMLMADGDGLAHFRNATSPQALRVANTYTSATNYEAAGIDWQTTSNVARIGTVVGAGGGTVRPVQLVTGSDIHLTLTPSAGVKISDAYTLPTTDGDPGDVLTTDGSGGVTFEPPSGGSGHVIEDDGTPMTARSALNFTGNVTVTDDAMGDATVIDILGGSGSPAGSGTELQYRVDGSTFGEVVNSSVSGKTITMGEAEALGTTLVPYLSLQNTTAAAAGAQQNSPMIVFRGQGWKTNATAGSQPVDFGMYVAPDQGAAAPTAQLVFASRINNGAWSNSMTYNASGVLSVPGRIITSIDATSIQMGFTGILGNIYVPTAAAIGSTVSYALVGSSGLSYKALMLGGTSANTIISNYSLAGLFITNNGTYTEAASGTHPLVSNLAVKPIVLNNGSATTTNGATVYIEGPATGTATITNNYSLWVDDGVSRFDGAVTVPDAAYDASTWNGNNEVPTKNAIRDKIESIGDAYTKWVSFYGADPQPIAIDVYDYLDPGVSGEVQIQQASHGLSVGHHVFIELTSGDANSVTGFFEVIQINSPNEFVIDLGSPGEESGAGNTWWVGDFKGRGIATVAQNFEDGEYCVNFSTPFSDDEYAVTSSFMNTGPCFAEGMWRQPSNYRLNFIDVSGSANPAAEVMLQFMK